MRFESLLWTVFAMFLAGGFVTRVDSAAAPTGGFQALDGGTENPPPTKP